MNESLLHRVAGWQRTAWVVGGMGCMAWLVGIVFARHAAFQSYWFAWIFWSGIGFGALSILLTQFLSGGAWGEVVRPSIRAATSTVPFMALLMIPIFFSMGDVFPWANAHGLTEASPHKRAYLSVPWFMVRAFIYFGILSMLGTLLRFPGAKARQTSAAGIVIYAGCMLFASTDWVMSLEPRWYSTMLVVIVMAWQFLAALALAVIIVTALARVGLPVTTKQLHDLGNLLLAFVIFWTYVSFAQFLIIWSGNLPREISWYLPRSAGGWQYAVIALAALQFAFPFALLLSRARKQHPRRLLPIAVLIFAASVLDVFWLIVPSFRPTGFHVQWLDVIAFIGIGGLWVGAFLGFSRRELPGLILAAKEVTHG
ncbi:MAG: hypothetical protein P4L99_07670 [Chthoniobacter sp.]|nr:hypothetical protein [Chthoniobacter sp.]